MSEETAKVQNEKSEKIENQKWNKEVQFVQKENTNSHGGYRTICGEILVDSPAAENPKQQVGKVFYTAYLSNKENKNLMFLFNGGPGSSSVWLHLGAFGPQRVHNLDANCASSSSLIENSETLLSSADLVFVDPIGTGFSTCAEGEIKNFCTEKADATYLSQFITLFLIQNKLWGRKIYLCGESYGGYRVSLIAQHLIKKESLHPEGLILIAPFISGSSIEESNPNILGEAHFLIGYIMSAWYHKRSSLNSVYTKVSDVYKAARDFCYQEYLPARLHQSLFLLEKGLHEKISSLTGISSDIFLKHNLDVNKFTENLFHGEKRFAGRIDSRYVLEHPLSFTEDEYIDPSTVSFSQRLTPLTQNYFFSQMNWSGKKAYTLMSDEVSKNWRYEESFYLSAFHALQSALKLSPQLKIYAAAGFYDLAVPAATIEYDLNQLAETKDMKKRIALEIFETGHMMYVHDESRKKLVESIRSFISSP